MVLPGSTDLAIDWDRGIVADVSGGQTVLRAQSLAVLKELHSRPGNLISKGELLDKVWPGISVSDDSLVQCIAELRRAFKDENHTIIKTMPKRGYIFDAPHSPQLNGRNGDPFFVSALEDVSNNPQSIQTTVLEKSIVVLPFVNLSNEPGQDFFVDGLSEDIFMGLSKTKGLFVIARNSAFAYKSKAADARQVAYDLGVTYVLEGSVRRSGNKLRVNAQLVNGRDGGVQVFAERIDHELSDDVFASQDELSSQLVAKTLDFFQLSGRLAGSRPKNKEAHLLCVRSREMIGMSKNHCMLAQMNFETALRIEPENLEARFQLAFAHACMWYHWSAPEMDHRKTSFEYAQSAVDLAPRSSAACSAMAWMHVTNNDLGAAQTWADKALSLNPNNTGAYFVLMDVHMLSGKLDLALEAGTKLFRQDPHGPGAYSWTLGTVHYHAARYEESVAVLMRPETYNSGSKKVLAAALAMLGRTDEARHEANLYMNLNPDWHTLRDAPKRLCHVAEHNSRFVEGYQKAGLPD